MLRQAPGSFPCAPSRYDQGGCAQAAAALSKPSGGGGRADRRVTLSQIADEGLGLGGQPAWVQVRVLGNAVVGLEEMVCAVARTLQSTSSVLGWFQMPRPRMCVQLTCLQTGDVAPPRLLDPYKAIFKDPHRQVVATVAFLRNENMYYPACPLPFNGKTCNKKLQDHTGDGNL